MRSLLMRSGLLCRLAVFGGSLVIGIAAAPAAEADKPAKEAAIVVKVAADGKLAAEGKPVELDYIKRQAEAQVAQLRRTNPKAKLGDPLLVPVEIHVDRATPFHLLYKVIQSAQKTGFRNFKLSADKADDDAEGKPDANKPQTDKAPSDKSSSQPAAGNAQSVEVHSPVIEPVDFGQGTPLPVEALVIPLFDSYMGDERDEGAKLTGEIRSIAVGRLVVPGKTEAERLKNLETRLRSLLEDELSTFDNLVINASSAVGYPNLLSVVKICTTIKLGKTGKTLTKISFMETPTVAGRRGSE